MDQLVKTELAEENNHQIVKVERHVTEEEEIATLIVQDNQIISSHGISEILGSYTNSNVQIVQLEDGQYTYIFEHPGRLDEGTKLELTEGHYIIEEYQEENEEVDQNHYETLYIQPSESPQGEEPQISDVYTISEEIEEEEVEEYEEIVTDGEQIDEVIEDVVNEVPVLEKKPESPVSDQTDLQSKMVQAVKLQSFKKELKPPAELGIKQELEENLDSDFDESSVPHDTDGNEDDSAESDSAEETETVQEVRVVDLTEYVYECSLCNKAFKTPSGVRRHFTLTHSEQTEEKDDVLSFSLCYCCGEPSDSAHTTGDFSCDDCNKLFIQQNSLARHRSIEHPTGPNYVCVDCKKVFSTKQLLIEHTSVHSLKAVKCEDCGKEFTRKYHLERHIGQTGCMGVPKQVYECRVCHKAFTRKDNLADHLKGHAGIMNKKKRQYICEYCRKEFTGLALLQIHVRTHTGERPYGCDICEKKFPSSGAMKKHRRKHTGEKPYSCPQCGVKFAAKETLNRHWRTHTGDKPHKCKFCGKAFIQASQLRAHIFHHTGENAFTCQHCGRAFNRKLRLTTHIRYMHEGEEPLPCPLAPECKKTFFRKEDIHRHMMTHSGEKPFKCDVCEKSFSVKSSLKIHKNIHNKEPAVSCEVCCRAFIRKDCLMRHMRAKHRELLEDIVANAEKKQLQKQLLRVVANSKSRETVKNTPIWNEFTLTESIKSLLNLLVDEECLQEFGHPDAPVDRVLESVIRRCGHLPAEDSEYDYISKMRENAKLLFTVVIDDKVVKELLNKQTVDEVIIRVLKLAKSQAEVEGEEARMEDSEDGIEPILKIDKCESEESTLDEYYEDNPGEVDGEEYVLGEEGMMTEEVEGEEMNTEDQEGE